MALPQDSEEAGVSSPVKPEIPRITDRWETLFIYTFIMKFTLLKDKLSNLNTPMDFEDAVMYPSSNPILLSILQRFLTNLQPTCDTKPAHIERTLVNVIDHMFASKERSIWWDIHTNRNIHPLLEVGFFSAPWVTKIEVLRQLVEWQLTHSPSVKALVDDAWGVKHTIKAKGKAQPPAEAKNQKGKTKSVKLTVEVPAAPTKADLEFAPLGLDASRKRFWVADHSPRVYSSGNPWKNICPLVAVSSSREEYINIIQQLKDSTPPIASGSRRNKYQVAHDDLIKKLDKRLSEVDEELARVEKQQKKIRDKEAALARAMELVETRQARTRNQARQVDYTAMASGGDTDDDNDDHDSGAEEWKDVESATRKSSRRTVSSRASSSAASSIMSTSNKRKRGNGEWRGERRSSRISKGRYQLEDYDEYGSLEPPAQPSTRASDASRLDDDAMTSAKSHESRSKKRRVISSPEPDEKDDEDATMAEQTSSKASDSIVDEAMAKARRLDTDDRRSSLNSTSHMSDPDLHPRSLASSSSLSSLSGESDDGF